MTDNENIITEAENANETDYIAVIQEMKQNTVSRDEYNKLKAENSKLFKALASGEQITNETKQAPKSIEELRRDVRSAETSLDGFKASLALRAAVLEKTGEDVFVPHGSKILPTDEDKATAARVASTLQEWVEESGDDPLTFARIMEQRTVGLPVKRK